jgi:CHASE3 domain sensor protein
MLRTLGRQLVWSAEACASALSPEEREAVAGAVAHAQQVARTGDAVVIDKALVDVGRAMSIVTHAILHGRL